MHTRDNRGCSSTEAQKLFYDLKQIENIPILDVCQHFGIQVFYRGGKPWCKLRPNEKTPSTILNTEATSRSKANTFYDFGVHEGGNTITLACMMMGLDRYSDFDRYQAIQHLAEVFHISPARNEKFYAGNLTNSQYAKIGLYGDLATKNFSFDPERMDIDRIQEISEKYAVPMNQLKKEHPHTYERLLKRVSVPLIENFRNSLYMDIWTGRETARNVAADGQLLFQQQEFAEDLRQLQEMDEIFNRAIIGTHLKEFPNRSYDPEGILKKIDSGEIKPKLGNRTFRQMQKLAKKHQTTLKYRPLDGFSFYLQGEELLGDTPYSAFLDQGKAVVGYLEKDYDTLQPIFEQFAWTSASRLHDKLQDAEYRVNPTQSGAKIPIASEQQH